MVAIGLVRCWRMAGHGLAVRCYLRSSAPPMPPCAGRETGPRRKQRWPSGTSLLNILAYSMRCCRMPEMVSAIMISTVALSRRSIHWNRICRLFLAVRSASIKPNGVGLGEPADLVFRARHPDKRIYVLERRNVKADSQGVGYHRPGWRRRGRGGAPSPSDKETSHDGSQHQG